MLKCACSSHRITYGNQFSPSTTWVPRDQTQATEFNDRHLYLKSLLVGSILVSIEEIFIWEYRLRLGLSM